VAAATASPKGGTVYFPAGTWNVGDLNILLPPYSSGKHVSLKGSGREATLVQFSINTGAGTYAIKGSGTALADAYYCDITDMRITGPYGRPATLGTWPANSMSGIKWHSGMIIERVHMVGFYAAVESMGNHSSMSECVLADNYYGVYFTPPAGGDISIINCTLSGNVMASIGVSNAVVATFAMFKGHLGFGPYGIYIEENTGGVVGLSLGGVLIDGTSWEFMGNGAIYSEGQTGRIDGLILIGCGPFQASTTYKIPTRPHQAHIWMAEMVNTTFVDTNMIQPPETAFIDIATVLTGFRWVRFKQSYDASKTAGVPFIQAPTNKSRQSITLDGGETLVAFAAPTQPFFAIEAGQLLELRDIATVQPYGSQGASAKGLLVGVALNTVAASSREYVIVATKGYDVTVQSDAAVTGTHVLVPSTATPAKVVGLASDGTTATVTKPIVGFPVVATTTAGTVRANIRF
jgi:hypothetical protein